MSTEIVAQPESASGPAPTGEPARPPARGRLLDPLAISVLATLISGAWAGRPSFWYDEGATISAAASRTLPELWKLLSHIDAVHGLYYLLMHGWFAIFPPTEFWSRAPSALAVGAAAAAVVVFVKQLAPPESARTVALCAGVIFAILPRITWAGIEARSSALSVTAAAWLTVLFIAAVRRNRPRLWVSYALVLMVSILININLGLLVPFHGALLPLVAPAGSRKSPALRWVVGSAVALAAMTPFVLFAHGQIFQVAWIKGLHRSVFLDVVHRQYFDYSVPFAIVAGVVVLAAIVTAVATRSARTSSPDGRRLLLAAVAWVVIPTAIVLIYSALFEPIYFPRYLIQTTPGAAVVLAICVVTITRKPWPRAGIAVALALLTAAAFPNYYFNQRGPYAKEGWDYSQVADLISAHAAPGDCLLVDNTVPWRPGPVRALLATRPDSFRSLIDVERGFYGPKVGALWDGHVAVWLTTAKINKCSTLWTITNRDKSLPDHQVGQKLPPGSAFGRTPVYQFPSYLGFHIVERWQFNRAQVVKSTR
ncbi:glycosyltransferase family 39 protein [Mycobacterium bourgelatii]|uniref:Mannosyltransferase n=1 Tax=Mycobacterium bourgelatii TaxID=1273442 RepID=A0A7I9YNW7_MYCBU|nr:glycosyltransferase family 39 protein [Mycobacterium bourgelatii]MCV6975913.1 glycosyltransferase family 39 protein [Mycobacterium bourgelatii]GFG90360.1 mannosyltransferase [Mycobacterium bourgelatii]